MIITRLMQMQMQMQQMQQEEEEEERIREKNKDEREEEEEEETSRKRSKSKRRIFQGVLQLQYLLHVQSRGCCRGAGGKSSGDAPLALRGGEVARQRGEKTCTASLCL